MARREFTRDVRAQIVLRATNAAGHVTCEGCGLVLGKKAWHVDHTKPDGLEVDKRRKLTAADGKLLGVECCHKPKSRVDVGHIAEAKARQARDLGIKRPKGRIPSPPKAERTGKAPLPPRAIYREDWP